MIRFFSITALAAVGALELGSAEAATLSVIGVSGEWVSVQPTPTTSNLSALGGAAIWWGTGSGSANQSGYTFSGHAPSGPFVMDQVFDVGTFTHQNQAIDEGTSILGAALKVTFELLIENQMATIISLFDFAHFETPNEAVPCADGEQNGTGANSAGCADRVTAKTNLGSSRSYTINGVEYVVDVTGFLQNGELVNQFWTVEGNANAAVLQARFTDKATVVVPAPVPLPATAWLLIAAMGVLAIFRVQRRTAQDRSSVDGLRP